jgi:AP-1 complex subunit gamma-1
MDLLGGLDLTGTSTTIQPVKQVTNVDLLGDLFGTTSINPVVPLSAPRLADPLGDLLGGSLSTPVPPPTFNAVSCYEKNGLTIMLQPLKDSASVTQLKATFTATTEITNVLFQVAVPKTCKLAMQPASGTIVSPTTQITQLLRIENSTKQPLRLRIKLTYHVPNGPVDEIVDFSSFDSRLWSE